MVKMLYASVRESFDPKAGHSLDEVKAMAERDWRVDLGKAQELDVLIAVYNRYPIGAWRVESAELSDVPWDKRSTKKRVRLTLGEGVPLQRDWMVVPDLQNGCRPKSDTSIA